MAITIITAAPTKQLTILRMVKDVLGIGDTDTSKDNLISDLIDRASRIISASCNRDFAKQTITETLPGKGGQNLMLSRFPIISITYVKYKGTTVDSSLYTLQEPEKGIIFADSSWNNTLGVFDYEVKYDFGYVLPGFTTGTRNLPEDIEHACIELTKLLYLSRSRDSTVKSEEVPDVYKVTYNTGAKGIGVLPPEIEDITDKYRVYNI